MCDYIDKLNSEQREAVLHTEGPLLVLAGAGSGKTRVLTCRTAYLIDKKGVKPWNIMAITFTNKAAGEMRERVNALVGKGAETIWVSTFHSACCRILRRHIDRLGYDSNFAIYDTDDQKQVMKEVIRKLELDPKVYRDKAMLARISSAKNEMIGPEEFEKSASSWSDRQVSRIYYAYQARLLENNALDFDDLLVKTVELFKKEPAILESYQDRFRYIMVDEYQDTNTVQFLFVSMLAKKYGNLCVVGDDDQSIYKFRGANINNILNFENTFKGAKVVKLEENYRSTQNILDAANAVISHNYGRKEKKLWTRKGSGAKIRFRSFDSGYEEAEFVAEDIASLVRQKGMHYSDFAVLYRKNSLSRLFEEKFVFENIPYRIVGGVNFYARKEIKDLLAYLKTINSGRDDLSVERIINIPKRGIGQTTIARVAEYAANGGKSFYEALLEADRIEGTARARSRIDSFVNLIGRYRAAENEGASVTELLKMVIEDTKILLDLQAEGTDEAKARIENIEELVSKTKDYDESTDSPSLSDFLQQVSLVADIDTVDEDSDHVMLMTVHSAKGLEFDSVYMVGMEENNFPGYLAVGSDDKSELEEERRLCYVGITRARNNLTMTAAEKRIVRGEPEFYKASRFVREIPREYIELDRETTDTRRFMEPPEFTPDRIFSYGSRKQQGYSYGDAAEKPVYGSLGYYQAKRMEKEAPPSGKSRRHPAGASRFNIHEFKVVKADHLDYGKGDRVRHVKFGAGTVTDIKEGRKDFEVTVDFDNYGIKRMFASFAKLKKIDE